MVSLHKNYYRVVNYINDGLFLNEMSLEDKVRWGDVWREYDNPLDFLREHHDGLTRGQLHREDPSLYQRLRKDGLLEHVPTTKADFSDDPVAYYTEHHDGLTRGELKKEDPNLYQRLRRDGLLEHVPTASRFGDDPVAYYTEHHDGLTRGQLQKEDPSLYQRLRRDGLLEHVPTGKRGRPTKHGDNPVAYYTEHHDGLTRGELAKEDPSLYERLRRDGLLEHVPLKQR